MDSAGQSTSATGSKAWQLGTAYAIATVVFTAVILFVSLPFLFNPYWTGYYNLAGPLYFFILVQFVDVGLVPIILIMSTMMALYILFFFFMIKASTKQMPRLIDTPAGFFSIVIPAVFLITTVVSLIEESLGVGIGGTSISSELVTTPFLAYNSLIYAPFAEEVGFRIIPLGIFSFLLIYSRGHNIRDSLYSIIAPGRMRTKYSVKTGWLDITLIVATSIIWGYAHLLYGAWDAGKILTVAITGIALGFGYLKFGVYVDIPMHWFFNGALTLLILYPPSVPVVLSYYFWVLIAGAAGIIMLVVYMSAYLDRGSRAPSSSK